MDITSKVSKREREDARMERGMQSNPPDIEPGMDDFFDNSGDDFFGNSGGNTNSGLGGWDSPSPNGEADPWGTSTNNANSGTDFFSGAGPFGSPPNAFGDTQPKEKSTEDKFFDGAKAFFTGLFTFSKELVKSFKTWSVPARMEMSKTSLIAGVIGSIFGIILMLFHLGNGLGLSILVGSLISVGVAVPLFMFSYNAFVNQGGAEAFLEEEQPTEPIDFSDHEEEDIDIFGENGNDDFPMDDMDDMDDEDFFKFDDDDEEFEPVFEFEEVEDNEVEARMDEVINNVNVDNGMVTRQYLFENIVNVLAPVTPSYANVREIYEGTDEFDAWDSIIQNSAKVIKTSKNPDDEMPYLISAKDKIFYTQLVVKRVNWLKNSDLLVDEIVNICRFDEDTGKVDTNINGSGSTVADKIYIKIMKGSSAMVSVKDMIPKVDGFIKDTKNYMPIILGVDLEGDVIVRDFKDINSLLVTGMPRSGKTWVVQAILAQMMFWLKPSDVEFHILDPKDSISDFKSMKMPHIRKFFAKDEEILADLRYLVKTEGVRREKIIGGAGFTKIFDYKQANPDVTDLPLIYVVIDEVITLADRMTTEVKDEFQSLLSELVTRLPALGIRIIMIPHVVKDQIIKKSITDNIPCRISVMGDSAHIEKSVGVKNFKHKLSHVGDMAVRFFNDEPQFIHATVLAKNSEGTINLYEFLRKFWTKIEPESINGSIYEKETRKSPEMSKKLDVTANWVNNNKQTTSPLSNDDISSLLNGVHGKDSKDTDNEINIWD